MLKDFIKFNNLQLVTLSPTLDKFEIEDLNKSNKELLNLITRISGTVLLEGQMREYRVNNKGEILIRPGSPWVSPGEPTWLLLSQSKYSYTGTYDYSLRTPHSSIDAKLYVNNNVVEKLEIERVISIDY